MRQHCQPDLLSDMAHVRRAGGHAHPPLSVHAPEALAAFHQEQAAQGAGRGRHLQGRQVPHIARGAFRQEAQSVICSPLVLPMLATALSHSLEMLLFPAMQKSSGCGCYNARGLLASAAPGQHCLSCCCTAKYVKLSGSTCCTATFAAGHSPCCWCIPKLPSLLARCAAV